MNTSNGKNQRAFASNWRELARNETITELQQMLQSLGLLDGAVPSDRAKAQRFVIRHKDDPERLVWDIRKVRLLIKNQRRGKTGYVNQMLGR